MGASLSLAIRNKKLGCEITGVVRSEKSRDEGLSQKIANKILLESEFLKSNSWNEYDFIVFSLPVDLTCDKIDLIPAWVYHRSRFNKTIHHTKSRIQVYKRA